LEFTDTTTTTVVGARNNNKKNNNIIPEPIFQKLLSKSSTLYGCAADWPLLSDFDINHWPECLVLFDFLADRIGKIISTPSSSVRNTRFEIKKFIDKNINLADVERTLEELYRRKDNKENVRILCAVSAALTYIVFGYRWGVIPITQEERDKTEMEFPKEIYVPWTYLNTELFGIPNGGNTWTLAIFNSFRNKETNMIQQRYFLNFDEKEKITEENFNVLFTYIELLTPSLFSSLDRTWLGILNGKEEEVSLGLQQLNKVCLEVMNLMRQTLLLQNIDYKTWTYKVEYPHAWGINGGVGPSGTQVFFYQLIDRSLGLIGNSKMYQSLEETFHTSILTPMKEVINTIKDAPSIRDYALKPNSSKFVVDAYNQVVETILLLRSTHKNRGGKYLSMSQSKMSSSNILEKMYNFKDVTLESPFHIAMTEKIDEVHSKFISKL